MTPIQYVGFRIVGFQIDVLLMIGLGLLEFLGVVGSAGHLEKYGADAINGAEIIGIDGENILEFRDGLIAEADVLLRRRAGNCTGWHKQWPGRGRAFINWGSRSLACLKSSIAVSYWASL